MQELRTLSHEIAGNPNLHPLAKVNEGWGIIIDQLTKGVNSLLFNRDIPIDLIVDKIILYVTHADDATENNVVTELGATATHTRRWKIAAIDSDKKHVNVRVGSTFSSARNLLIQGCIALISKSIPTC